MHCAERHYGNGAILGEANQEGEMVGNETIGGDEVATGSDEDGFTLSDSFARNSTKA